MNGIKSCSMLLVCNQQWLHWLGEAANGTEIPAKM